MFLLFLSHHYLLEATITFLAWAWFVRHVEATASHLNLCRELLRMALDVSMEIWLEVWLLGRISCWAEVMIWASRLVFLLLLLTHLLTWFGYLLFCFRYGIVKRGLSLLILRVDILVVYFVLALISRRCYIDKLSPSSTLLNNLFFFFFYISRLCRVVMTRYCNNFLLFVYDDKITDNGYFLICRGSVFGTFPMESIRVLYHEICFIIFLFFFFFQ